MIKDERICIIKISKKGAQAARNAGIIQAKSKWIAFLDSDDIWLSNKLEQQIDLIRKYNYNPFIVVHSEGIKYDIDKQKKTLCNLPPVEGDIPVKQLLKHPGPMFQTILTSKQVLAAMGLLDENVPSYQEWDTSIRLAKFCKWLFINEPLFVYQIHNDYDSISKNAYRDIKGYQYVVDKFKDEIIKEIGIDEYLHHVRNNILRALNYGLWTEAEVLYGKLSVFSFDKFVIKMLILLHLRPDFIFKMKKKFRKIFK
ncbi:glycosyltransferase [Candidatus Desantisbacteria bacterium]|nr:glycosyltransferase [Candidatus Desantisbacteria bacterium]